MVEVIRTQDRSPQSRLKGLGRWKVHAATRAEVRRFCEELALGKVNRGRTISGSRQSKYLDVLKVPLEFFNKPTIRLSVKDIERFEKALSTDQIQSRLKHTPYSHATKVDIRKALKIYLRWRLGEAKAVRLAGWIDTRVQFKTPDFLKEKEVDRLYRKCRTPEQRFIVAVLFDSGARAQEFLNIRFEDIRLPEGKENFVSLTLKQEYSKTNGRAISLYWGHSLDAVKDYLNERVAAGLQSSDPVYCGTYDAMRMFLARLGRSVLGRHVHPHLLRHTSATFYANKLNRQELCYRFGWRFSSDMPDIYISRAGMETLELDEKFTQTELSTLKDDLSRLSRDNHLKDERILQLQRSIAELTKNFQSIQQILAANPTIQDVESALRRKRGKKASRLDQPPNEQP